jgi:hypothetical protein
MQGAQNRMTRTATVLKRDLFLARSKQGYLQVQSDTPPVPQAIKNTPLRKLLEALLDHAGSDKAIRLLSESKEYNIA